MDISVCYEMSRQSLPSYSCNLFTRIIRNSCGRLRLRWGDLEGFYAPFGEVLHEYNAYWMLDTIPRLLFNSKELDEESGMYYYSARYFKPPTFISRDVLFEKYFWMSPYAYCGNNPVNLIDPDGRKKIPWFDREAKKNKYTVTLGYDAYPDTYPNTVINIFSHGIISGYNKSFVMMEAGKDGKFTVSYSRGFYMQLSKECDLLKNAENKDDLSIVLHACYTGMEKWGKSFAKEISAEPNFKNVLIIAPIGDLLLGIVDGSFYEYDTWNAYYNGQNIGTYIGSMEGVNPREYFQSKIDEINNARKYEYNIETNGELLEGNIQ